MRPLTRRATGAVIPGVSAATVRQIGKSGIPDARCGRALLCVGLLLACSSMAASAGAQTVVATDLGTLPGGTYSSANAVNVNGQGVGSADTFNGGQHAFSWTPFGGMVDLGTPGLGVGLSVATAVNANGQVVG